MPRTPESPDRETPNRETPDRETPDRQTEDRHSGQAQVPKPPSDKEVEEISRAQDYLTDDWTGDGGKPEDLAHE